MRQFDIQKLDALVDAGKLMRQVHPTLPLRIYKYTPELQFANEWDDLTVRCRGLVVDNNGYQYSNPIPKFHNIEELTAKEDHDIPWGLSYEITDKVDGSCIEVFWYKNDLIVCTLGSFESDQARIAKEMLNEYQGRFDSIFERDKTYIFELIVPENRIVLDYGFERSLVLLTIRHNDTDEDITPEVFGDFKVVEKLNKTIAEIIEEKKRTDFINKEGFVVKFSNGFRMKVKYEEYFRLHKIMTGVNEKFIWEFLRDGKPLPLENVPDEFFKYVTEVKDRLLRDYIILEEDAKNTFNEISKPNQTRKEFALAALQHTYSSVLFKMLENKDYSQIIWKTLEPKSTDKPKFNSFRGVSQDDN